MRITMGQANKQRLFFKQDKPVQKKAFSVGGG
jgi:hypothetical protein